MVLLLIMVGDDSIRFPGRSGQWHRIDQPRRRQVDQLFRNPPPSVTNSSGLSIVSGDTRARDCALATVEKTSRSEVEDIERQKLDLIANLGRVLDRQGIHGPSDRNFDQICDVESAYLIDRNAKDKDRELELQTLLAKIGNINIQDQDKLKIVEEALPLALLLEGLRNDEFYTVPKVKLICDLIAAAVTPTDH